MKKVFINGKFLLLLMLVVISIAGCTKYPDPAVINETYGADSATAAQRKVLVISIDGATGSEIKTIAPPNIVALEQHGKYTYNVHLDPNKNTDAASWATMLNGVSYSHHLISDSSFQLDLNTNGNFEGTIPYFPDFFNFIYQAKGNYKTALISPWSQLVNNFNDADFSYAVMNDAVVKDSAIAILKRESALGAIVLDFNEVEVAGLAGAFSASDAGYKAAILNADGYVGNVMDALKARPNYSKENWLVIVTTNHGGSSANPKPGFVVYSNPSLSELEVRKIGFNSVQFTGASTYATLPNTVYNFNNDFTIQLDVLMPAAPNNYPTFFGNKTQLNGGAVPGFSFLIDYGTTWTFNTTSGSKFQVASNRTMVDGTWHTITATFTNNVITTYTDGIYQGKGTIPSGANFNGPDPLAIGNQPSAEGAPGSSIPVNVHNIEIFNIALDSATIRKNICLQDITQHPYYSNLIDFWPCDDAVGISMSNTINLQNNFFIQGGGLWSSMSTNIPCSVVPDAGAVSFTTPSIVASNADVVPNMLYWLQIKQKDVGANIDGSGWLVNFEKEIYGL